MWNPFKKKNKTYSLGIDIGTSSIKIVELLHDGNNIKLNNYAQFFARSNYIGSSSGPFSMLDSHTVTVFRDMFLAANFVSKSAVVALPVFSSFSTLIELPTMSEGELKEAIEYEIRKYIPVPVSEVQFDWIKIESLSSPKKIKLLVIAVPNEIINKFNNIADATDIHITNMELETFSMARALIPQSNSKTTAILEVGYRTTNVGIVSGGVVVMHHNIGMGGINITKALASGMSIDIDRAEEIKRTNGILDASENVLELLKTSIDKILAEASQVLQNYVQEGGVPVEKIILTGGNASMPGFVEYIKQSLSVEVEIGNPFNRIEVPNKLKEKLNKDGPSFAVATGLALRK